MRLGMSRCTGTLFMLTHPDLPALTLHTDWDDPLVSELCHVALFYYENGFWDRLKDEALYLLNGFNDDPSDLHRPLRQAFNAWLLEVQKHDFDFEGGESLGDLEVAEQHLADTLLDYYADPDMYRIVHAVDEDHNDDAWFLCYTSDVEDLGLDKTISA
ncbi:hypothetical protein BH24DEI2_BH24DEI2_15830 [soil metagenome]